jgi:hypothetical protein
MLFMRHHSPDTLEIWQCPHCKEYIYTWNFPAERSYICMNLQCVNEKSTRYGHSYVVIREIDKLDCLACVKSCKPTVTLNVLELPPFTEVRKLNTIESVTVAYFLREVRS